MNPPSKWSGLTVQSLIKHADREALHRDPGCTGLYLRVRPGSAASWVHVYTFKGKARRPSIGTYPEISLAEARDQVQAQRKLIAGNVDPVVAATEREATEAAAKREAEAIAAEAAARLTVRQAFEKWHQAEIAGSHRDNGELVRGHFERHVLPYIGDKYASEIRVRDVRPVLDRIREAGHMRTANVVLQHLKRVFRDAALAEDWEASPIDLLTRRQAGGKEEDRDRYLDTDELRLFAAALPRSGMTSTNQAALWLLIATGMRVGALCSLKWTDVDEANGTLSAWNQKRRPRKRYTVPLSEFALQKLAEIHLEQKRKGIKTAWVLYSGKDPEKPLSRGALNGQIQDRQAVHQPDRTRKGRVATNDLVLPNGHWIVHDLRRTMSSHMRQLGVPEEIRRACQDHHSDDRLSVIYDRADLPLSSPRAAFDALGIFLQGITSGAVPA